jgi:hypothetical protein
LNAVQEFCRKKNASLKLEKAFTEYCKQSVREYYSFYNGDTTTTIVMRFNDEEIERMWNKFLSELKPHSS